jgi:hypothetical protein
MTITASERLKHHLQIRTRLPSVILLFLSLIIRYALSKPLTVHAQKYAQINGTNRQGSI